MRWYARSPRRRTLQVLADLALLLWLVPCVWWATAVDHRFEDLADRIRTADTATSSLSSGLTRAGDLLDGVPLVGEDVRGPFDDAAGASDDLGRASLESADTTERVGTWISVAVFAMLFGPVAAQHLPRRLWFALTAARTARLAASPASADLLALRALTARPPHEVAAAVPDAADGWRRGDREVIAALVALELRDAGLSPDLSAAHP